MKIDFMLFETPWHDNKFINKYGISIPNILLIFFSVCLEPTEDSLNVLIEKLDKQYINNFQLWYKWHNLTP